MLTQLLDTAGIKVFERGWLSANNVLFDGRYGDETVLVDSGYASHAAQTLSLVKRALGERRLDRIVNTHLHSDHCGGNRALQAAFGCAIDVPVGELDKVDRWDEAALSYLATGQQCPPFSRTGALHESEELLLGGARWRVVAAPGHDPESVVLYQRDLELLISADALWENGFGVVFPELEGEHAFEDVRATLNRMGELSIKWIIPGHGRPFENVALALERAHRRLDGFIADPARHARHAAKVLIKFHLLEWQQRSLSSLLAWMLATRCIRLSHEGYFPEIAFEVWCRKLLFELAATGAIHLDNEKVANA